MPGAAHVPLTLLRSAAAKLVPAKTRRAFEQLRLTLLSGACYTNGRETSFCSGLLP
jgi:hypothetical protein